MKNDREKSKKKTFLILDCVFEFFTLNFSFSLTVFEILGEGG